MTAHRRLLVIVAACLLAVPGAGWGQTLDQFLKAADQGNAKVVADYLTQGLDPNTTDKFGNTLLMNASRQGHEELVKLLLDRKADVTRRGPTGDTALMLASLKGHLGIVKILVDRGSPISQPGWAPLHFAAFECRTEVVKYLLEKGAEKDAVAPNGYSALLLAMRNGHMDAARELLYADVDVRLRAPNGETALSLAKKREDKGLEELLRRAGAAD